MVQGLRIGFRRLGQPWQGLAFGLGHQTQLEVAELFKLPDIGKDRAVVRAVVIDKGDGGRGFSRLGHGVVSFFLDDEDNAHACRLYAHSDRRGITQSIDSGQRPKTRAAHRGWQKFGSIRWRLPERQPVMLSRREGR